MSPLPGAGLGAVFEGAQPQFGKEAPAGMILESPLPGIRAAGGVKGGWTFHRSREPFWATLERHRRRENALAAYFLLIAASILAARKLAQYEGGTRVPATVSAIADSIRWAERIMEEIDRRWPSREVNRSAIFWRGLSRKPKGTSASLGNVCRLPPH